MPWTIQCSSCKTQDWANNIVDLFMNFLPKGELAGLFTCRSCGKNSAYISQEFYTQEGDAWTPHRRGVIRLEPNPREIFQTFASLISYEPDGEISDWQLGYFKDLRPFGGRLMMGSGPGGSPVLSIPQLGDIIAGMKRLGLSPPAA